MNNFIIGEYAILEIILSFLEVNELVDTFRVNKTFSQLSSSNYVWLHSYALQWNLDISCMNPNLNWKNISLQRNKMNFTTAPSFLSFMKIEERIADAKDDNELYSLGENIKEVYKIFEWSERFEDRILAECATEFRKHDGIDHDRFPRSADILTETLNISFLHSRKNIQTGRNVDVQFVYHSFDGLPCLFEYFTNKEKNKIHFKFQLLFNGKFLMSERAIDEQTFFLMKNCLLGKRKEAVSNIAIVNLLLLVTTTANKRMDREHGDFPLFFLDHFDMIPADKEQAEGEGSSKRKHKKPVYCGENSDGEDVWDYGSEDGEDGEDKDEWDIEDEDEDDSDYSNVIVDPTPEFYIPIPSWMSQLMDTSKWINKEQESFETCLGQNKEQKKESSRDDEKENRDILPFIVLKPYNDDISKSLPEDVSIVDIPSVASYIPPRVEIDSGDFKQIQNENISKQIRLALFRCYATAQIKAWVSTIKDPNQREWFEKAMKQSNFVVPVQAVSRFSPNERQHCEFTQFIIHSSVTGKKHQIMFFSEYQTMLNGSILADRLHIEWNNFSLVEITRTGTKERQNYGDPPLTNYFPVHEGQVIKGDQYCHGAKKLDKAYEQRMTHIFAQVKLDLFGKTDANVSLENFLKFLSVVGLSAKKWRKQKEPNFYRNLIDFFDSFVQGHKDIWEKSNLVTEEQLATMKSDREIHNEKLAIKTEKKHNLLKEYENAPSQKHSFSFCASASSDKVQLIPFSQLALLSDGCALTNFASWPPVVYYTGVNLNCIRYSHDGNFLIGTREVKYKGGVQRDLYVYNTKSQTPKFIISHLDKRPGSEEVLGMRRKKSLRADDSFRDIGIENKTQRTNRSDVEKQNFASFDELVTKYARNEIGQFFEEQDILSIDAPPCVGFIDNRILLGGANASPDDLTFTKVNLPLSWNNSILLLPTRQQVTLSALFSFDKLYQFNPNTNEFKEINVVDEKGEKFIFAKERTEFIWKNEVVYFVQHMRLYELSWNELPNTLKIREHLMGLYHISNIVDVGSLGLFIVAAESILLQQNEGQAKQRLTGMCMIYQPNTSIEIRIPFSLLNLRMSDKEMFRRHANLQIFWNESQRQLFYLKSKLKTDDSCRACFGKICEPTFWVIGKEKSICCNKCYEKAPKKMKANSKQKKRDTSAHNFVKGKSVLTMVSEKDILSLPPVKRNPLDQAKIKQSRQFETFSTESKESFVIYHCQFSRAEKVFYLNRGPRQDYTICEMWERKEGAIPSPLLLPKEKLKTFSSPIDLVASNIGASVLFKYFNSSMYVASIIDFVGYQKSNEVEMMPNLGSTTHVINLNKIEWIGVLEFFAENEKNAKQVKTEIANNVFSR